MIVVSDNSVLSCLAELDELDLLQRLYGTLTLPETIRAEASHPGAPAALRQWIAAPPDWVSVAPDPVDLLEETRVLDRGEAAAITLAWHHRESSLLLIDERRGRSIGAALGLQMVGTAGLLTDAAVGGMVDFDEVFTRLAKTRFRLAESVVETLRRRLRGNQGPV